MNLHEKTDRYLNGQMSMGERQLFEQEIAADEKLAKSVELQRELAQFFKTNEPALEKQLSELGDQYFGQQKKIVSWKIWGWLVAFLLITFLAVRWMCASADPAPEKTYPPNDVAIDPTRMEPADKQAPTQTPVPEPADQTTPAQQETKTTPPVPEKPSEQKRPIASIDKAAYEVNPILESLLTERVRHSAVTQIFSPSTDTVFTSPATVPFLLKAKTSAKAPYELLIYSNRTADFDNDRPVLKKTLTGKEGNNIYTIQFMDNLTLDNGLYYWILRSAKSGELLHVSKFRKGTN